MNTHLNHKHINKLLKVWETKNTILKPIEKKDVIDIIDQIALLFSAGTFYYFIMNFETRHIDYASEGTKTVLGIEPNDYSLEKFLKILHPKDLEKIHQKEATTFDFKLNRIPKEDITKYKTVYLMRLKDTSGNYKTILHQAKALTVSDDGKLFQVLSIHTDITHLNPKIDHKISLISNERPSFYSIETANNLKLIENNFKTIFTKREKQILEEIAKGNTFSEIAKTFHVSPHTINTHKKNILRKSHCKNTAELITTCIREGII
ncbi:LuxR C-terminal-related transcriptional regulator [Thalassobellus citreus]|uniref:LuxR C-terminal-related transcriptional regulator n=1 Tax=Thalassobellus citreus TaxID=3367752 RepID=UPI0037B8BC21